MFVWTCKHMFGLSLLTSISHNYDFEAIEDYLHNPVHFAELHTPTVHLNGLVWLWEPILCLIQIYYLLPWDGPGPAAEMIGMPFLILLKSERRSWHFATTSSYPLPLRWQPSAERPRDRLQLHQWQWLFLYDGDGRQPYSRGLYAVPNTRISDGRWCHHPEFWEFRPIGTNIWSSDLQLPYRGGAMLIECWWYLGGCLAMQHACVWCLLGGSSQVVSG